MTGAGPAAPLALTQGDPAGIGPELTLKAWHALKVKGPVFAVLGGPDLYRHMAQTCGIDTPIVEIERLCDARRVFGRALPVFAVDVADAPPVVPGEPDAGHARGTLASIEGAVTACLSGAACAVVTNPINKAALYGAGFSFPGHTEFLAALAGRLLDGPEPHPVMMLAAPALRVVPLTIHEPLRRVPGLITRELIIRTARIMDLALRTDFGLPAPRIAVAGLNPHAGEGGAIGTEDRDIILPALDDLRREGLAVAGPLPADTMFHPEARCRYDAALCMYHDQALVPLKTLDFDRGVNVTLGLPFVRTSPDHGTAYDIAGAGTARPDSLIAALHLGAELGARRSPPSPGAPSL